MPQLDKNTFNYQLVIVFVLFASLFLLISWVSLSVAFSRMVTRAQMDLTATDDFRAFEKQGIFLLGFNEFLVNTRFFLAKKNLEQKSETKYFEKSLYFFIIKTLMYGNHRYALIMDKMLVYIIHDYANQEP